MRVYLAIEGTQGWAFVDGSVFELDLALDRPAPTPAFETDRPLTAPMPATVLRVLVEPGQAVRQGDPLIVLEAMKMEVTLRAPRDGQIETLACARGDLVQPEIPLVTLTHKPPSRARSSLRLSDTSVTISTDFGERNRISQSHRTSGNIGDGRGRLSAQLSRRLTRRWSVLVIARPGA